MRHWKKSREKWGILKKFFVLIVFVLLVACSDISQNEELVTIEPKKESETIVSAERLGLGPIFEFDITYPDPENTLMQVWLELYENGEEVSDEQGQLRTYHENLRSKSQSIGWVTIDMNGEQLDLRLYDYDGENSSVASSKKDNILTFNLTAQSYLIEGKTSLQQGEELALATLYQSEDNYTREFNTLEELIEHHNLVYVMKIKVEEKIGGGA